MHQPATPFSYDANEQTHAFTDGVAQEGPTYTVRQRYSKT